MSAADKLKLDNIASDADVNVPTNLSFGTITTTTIPLNSSTGSNVTLPASTSSTAGLMTDAQWNKLDGIAAGATANAGTVTGVTATGAALSSSGGTVPNIVHTTTTGYKHIPSGGSADQFLKYSASGTAVWSGYTGGTGLALAGTTFSLNFAELTDMTGDIASTTQFILQNGTIESRKAASEIKLSTFNNNSNWTANLGTVTSVSASGALSSSGGTTPAITHSTSAGYKHIPTSGSTNQFLKYSASGTAAWSALPAASNSTDGISKVLTSTSLGTATGDAPSQNAVKAYVDNAVGSAGGSTNIRARASNASLTTISSGSGTVSIDTTRTLTQGDIIDIEMNSTLSVAFEATPKIVRIVLGVVDTSPAAPNMGHGWVSPASTSSIYIYAFQVAYSSDDLHFSYKVRGGFDTTPTVASSTLYVGNIWYIGNVND